MDWAFSLMIVCLFLTHEWIFGRVMFYVHPFISYPKYTLRDISFLYIFSFLLISEKKLILDVIYKFPFLYIIHLTKVYRREKFRIKRNEKKL
jgi:hypothetical protein